MARKGILTGAVTRPEQVERPPAPQPKPRGPVGALQSSLSQMQENAVQDISPDLIDDAGVKDRLGVDHEAHRQLRESLQTYGQQVPVLLRPHASTPGRYEIVYGRRRLRALKELGQPVKAMVRQLDDHALVMAQGQENTSRADLSFIEKASFAAQMQGQGYDRQTIAAALSMDQPMVSRMLKVGSAFDLPFLRQIGSAPGIGRDRWMELVDALKNDGALSRVDAMMRGPDFVRMASDERFEAALLRAKGASKAAPARPPASRARALRSASGHVVGELRRTGRALTVSIPSRTAEGFDDWVEANAEAVMQDLHDRWMNERSEDT